MIFSALNAHADPVTTLTTVFTRVVKFVRRSRVLSTLRRVIDDIRVGLTNTIAIPPTKPTTTVYDYTRLVYAHCDHAVNGRPARGCRAADRLATTFLTARACVRQFMGNIIFTYSYLGVFLYTYSCVRSWHRAVSVHALKSSYSRGRGEVVLVWELPNSIPMRSGRIVDDDDRRDVPSVQEFHGRIFYD